MSADSYADAWLSEMWGTCPEWHQTVDERERATGRNATLSGPSTADPQNGAQSSTGCAEIGGQASPEGHAGCA